MHEMDLIPAAYRTQRARRHRQHAWMLALCVIAASVVGARLWIERGLTQERTLKAQWQPQQDKARAQRAELQQLQYLIAQAKPTEEPSADAQAALAPTALLPSVLAALPATGLRLSSASLEAVQDAGGRLNLQGQTADEATLGRAVMLLQGHPQVAQVQLLGVKPESSGEQRFELLLRVALPAASAASAGTRP